ncbi:unnamed protein product [Brassica rapa subsp. trilocularis]
MSVVGLDLGNENCVIAVAKQRGIDVLLNTYRNTATESERECIARNCFNGSRFMNVLLLTDEKDLECVAGRASTLGNQTLFLPNRNITDHMEVENQMIWSLIDFSPRPHNSLVV